MYRYIVYSYIVYTHSIYICIENARVLYITYGFIYTFVGALYVKRLYITFTNTYTLSLSLLYIDIKDNADDSCTLI